MPDPEASTSTAGASEVTVPAFLRLAVPNIVAGLLVPLVGVVDTAMLGHLPQMEDLAGVALATVIFDVVLWSFGFLRMSTTALTAQAWGQRDDAEVLRVSARALSLACVIGLLFVALRDPIGTASFSILGGAPGVEQAGRLYYDARSWGAPFALMNYVVLGAVLGRQNGRMVVLLSVVGNLTNIGLDYLFIYRLGMGAEGAGWATASAQLTVFLLGFGWLAQKSSAEAPKRWFVGLWSVGTLLQTLTLNAQITIRTFALVGTFAIFTNVSALLGTTLLAANTILLKVIAIAAWVVDGYAFAVEAKAGALLGSGRAEKLRALLGVALGFGMGTGLLFGLLFGFVPSLFGLMTDQSAVLSEVRAWRWWLPPVLWVASMAYILDGYFLGLARGRTLAIAMVVSLAVGFVPLAWAARQTEDTRLLWAALFSFMVFRVTTLGVAVPSTLRIRRKSG